MKFLLHWNAGFAGPVSLRARTTVYMWLQNNVFLIILEMRAVVLFVCLKIYLF